MALYHTHRPQNFDSVIGQKHIVETIQNQILQNKVAHAYLFSGPRGVGKTTTARILAKAVNVPLIKGTPEPDNNDPIAIEINEGRCIDVIEIDAASHTGVDNVRQNIIENAQFKPTKCAKKVFIIDEVHMLSTAAFNALLKTLEEPPEHVLFILATTELHKLPVTIVSRCQRFQFKKVPQDIMAEHLQTIAKAEKVEIDAEVLKRIANKSEGCVRDGISLLDQVLSSGSKKITAEDVAFVLPKTHTESQIAFLSALIKKDTAGSFDVLSQIAEQGIHIQLFAEDVLHLARAIMVSQVDASFIERELDLGQDQLTTFKACAEAIQPTELVRLIDLLLKRAAQIKSSPTPELPLEMLIIEWTGSSITTKPLEKTAPAPVAAKTPEPTPPPVQETKVEEPVMVEEAIIEEPTPEPVVEAKPEPKPTPAPTGDVSFNDLKSKWNSIIQSIEKEYPSLGFIFKTITLTELTGNTILLNAQYSFHQEKLSETECAHNVETMIEKIMGVPLRIKVILTDATASAAQNNELTELTSAFGGEVV